MVGVSTKGRSTMYKLGMIGNFESLDPLLEAVYRNDTNSIEQLLSQGVSLNTPIELSHNIKITPLELAIITNNVNLCSFLIDHGASLEVYGDSPLFLTALRYGSNELISLFLALSTKLSEDEKFRAFNEVYWSNKKALIDILEQAGLSVAQYGGQAFRKAVAFNNEKLARVFLQKGVDVNFHEKDMVFPNASTPIIEAARNNHLSLVKLLIDYGADITLCDKYGDRPYSLAVKNKNHAMAKLLKELEPEDWHNEQEQLSLFKRYKAPQKLIDYLKTGPLRIEFPNEEHITYVELYSFMDVQEFTYKRKRFLSIMSDLDNYSDYLLLFYPKDKLLWYFDIEHEELAPLVKWDEFIHNPGPILNDMLLGKYAPND